MLGQAHAGLGWLIGAASPTSDRRLRVWCTAAALLPDVDALTYLLGGPVYDRFHHTFGHNIFTGAACMLAAAWFFRDASTRTWLAAVTLVGVSFASHLLTDMKFSGWELHLLWPLNRKGFQFDPNLQLGHWLNIVLVAVLSVLPFVVARWRQSSPLEIVSSRLDRLFLNLFRRKNRYCSACAKPCNNRCDACTKPVCLRHGRISARFRVTCPACSAPPAERPAGADALDRELGFIRSREAGRLDPEFAQFLERKLTEGLKRLDAVPRTSPIWEGSDQRPTLAKVADLARLLIHESPDDDEARWILFADSVRCCSADFSTIEPLVLRDFGSLHWLISAARWNFLVSGVDPVVALRGSFESLSKTVGSLETLLQDVTGDPDPRTRDAAARCLDLLHGRNPFVATKVVVAAAVEERRDPGDVSAP